MGAHLGAVHARSRTGLCHLQGIGPRLAPGDARSARTMKFAGKAWKLLVGIKDGLVLLTMLLFFGGLYGALSASPYKDSARSGALRLDLGGAVVEQPAGGSPFDLGGGGPGARPDRGSQGVPAP